LTPLLRILDAIALLVMPFLLNGVINRVKSLWSGRKGPPLFQLAFDVLRLLRKSSVYGTVTTPVFRIGPLVLLVTTVATGTIVPLLGGTPIASFPFDFVWLAYAWGLGRVAMILAALDTGSSFEGMGAVREATFSTLIEPALFLVTGALCLSSGTHTLSEALAAHVNGGASTVVWAGAVVCTFVVLQVEASRLPIDDPATHLELTMIHEVMVLDHGGPDLAAVQTAAATKLFVAASMLATLLNPWSGSGSAAAAALNLVLSVLVAVVVGTIESLVARLKLRAVPQYVTVALAAGAVALLACSWHAGGAH
jgi:formate hydrogenlyase subunit 4